MTEENPTSTPASKVDLEEKMRKVALVISLIGLGLMCAGFLYGLFCHPSFAIPGDAVISFGDLHRWAVPDPSRMAMSAGIVLLGLIPMVRVILACWLYVRAHDRMSAIVALVVLLELIASIRLSV